MPAAFLDTNILIHLTNNDRAFVTISQRLIGSGGIVSVQVLNEAVDTLRSKIGFTWPEVYHFLAGIRANCPVVTLSVDTHDRALGYADRHKLRIYDATILAAAVLSGCSVLYTEDMHNGLIIDSVTVRNPYKP